MAPEENQPFRLDRPARQTVPFLFASPHSGRSYPQSLLASTRLDATTLRRSEDAFVDELFAGALGLCAWPRHRSGARGRSCGDKPPRRAVVLAGLAAP